MKVFRYKTNLFLDYSLEYININSLDEIKNFDVYNEYIITIVGKKFIISYLLKENFHFIVNKEMLDKFLFNFLKYHEDDQTILFEQLENHYYSIEDHSNCYSI